MTTCIKYIIAILITTLIMCADVFAHGNPVAHFQPYTAEDPCWERACARILIIQVGMGISIVRKTGK